MQLSIESTRFFHILVNGEAEGVLDSKIFARSLIDLVRKTTSQLSGAVADVSLPRLSDDDEGNLVELLFLVATKIRLDPDILPAWFYPEREDVPEDGSASADISFVGVTRKNAFPLFYLLINFVHHDGRIGDFARTGLLYLTETASRSRILEKWMIESDLATTMASGLGALYSRLTRRLPYIEGDEKLPPVLALSDYVLPLSPNGFSSSEYHHNLEAFLSYLMFWQDTLDHCSSSEVTETLLDHFQVLFLQQLLYPSLLESSDIDGGSTASVITYLYRILAALDHPAIIERILQYLLPTADKSSDSSSAKPRRPRMSMSRRKSMNHLAALAEAQENPSPTLFNLLDLIVMSLKSKHPQTITSTCKLLSVITQKHHTFVRTFLYRTRPIHGTVPRWTVHSLNEQSSLLFQFALEIATDNTMNESYENVLSDVSVLLDSHSCHAQSVQGGNELNAIRIPQALDMNCLLMKEICDLLFTFFTNQTMTNLALTESIVSLAYCELISLDGWFVKIVHNHAANEQPVTICDVIGTLVDQVHQWRTSTPDWDAMFTLQRRKLLKDVDDESEDGRSASTHKERIPVQLAARDRRGRTLRSEVFGSMDASVSPPRAMHTIASHVTAASPASPALDYRVGSLGSRTSSPALDALHHRLMVPQQSRLGAVTKDLYGNDGFSSGAVTPSDQGQELADPSASLAHILTNAVILQEFILEIVAIMQVRATSFGEVSFDESVQV